MTAPEPNRPEPIQALPMDEFGARLLRTALAPDRIAGIVGHIVGDVIDFGPVPVGPRGIATATARGRPGRVRVTPSAGGRLRVRVPVSLAVRVRLSSRSSAGATPSQGSAGAAAPAAAGGMQVTRFMVHATVELAVQVRPCAPLGIAVEIVRPTPRGVRLSLTMSRVARTVLARIVDVEAELTHHILEYVKTALDSPAARDYAYIDLAAVIDRAWDGNLIGPARPPGESPHSSL